VTYVWTFVSQRNFELDIVNIHEPGQEHWRKKYVYWIPALHIDGKEVAKGRWDGQTVTQALNAWQKTLDGTPEGSSKRQP
jgi:zinc finger CCHC domain-containing protein 8